MESFLQRTVHTALVTKIYMNCLLSVHRWKMNWYRSMLEFDCMLQIYIILMGTTWTKSKFLLHWPTEGKQFTYLLMVTRVSFTALRYRKNCLSVELKVKWTDIFHLIVFHTLTSSGWVWQEKNLQLGARIQTLTQIFFLIESDASKKNILTLVSYLL